MYNFILHFALKTTEWISAKFFSDDKDLQVVSLSLRCAPHKSYGRRTAAMLKKNRKIVLLTAVYTIVVLFLS